MQMIVMGLTMSLLLTISALEEHKERSSVATLDHGRGILTLDLRTEILTKNTINKGVIIGITSAVIVLTFAVVLYFLRRRYQKGQSENAFPVVKGQSENAFPVEL